MDKPKLVLYSPELLQCSCYGRVFNTVFECHASESAASFQNKIQNISADAAVVCLCSAQPHQAPELLRLEALVGLVPVLSCSKFLNPESVGQAARQGVDRFLTRNMDPEKIRGIIYEAIRGGGLKAFLQARHPESLSSPYVRKLIDEVMHAFPHRLALGELAQRLGIGSRWLQRICRRAFDKTYSQLLRGIWVHQALRLMRNTPLDNTEIALHLNYSEESNLARDFRKELCYSPNEARRQLLERNPEDFFL